MHIIMRLCKCVEWLLQEESDKLQSHDCSRPIKTRVKWPEFSNLLSMELYCPCLIRWGELRDVICHSPYETNLSMTAVQRFMVTTFRVVPLFGKFYLWDKSDNPRMWLDNLAAYPTGKIYQKIEQPALKNHFLVVCQMLNEDTWCS